jgi:hypothetical protein
VDRTTPTIRNLQNYIRTCALANMHRWCVSTNYVVRRHQAFPNLDDYTTNWMGPPRYPHLAKLAKDIHTYSLFVCLFVWGGLESVGWQYLLYALRSRKTQPVTDY